MVNGSIEIDQGRWGYGAEIEARPENCDACRWAQVFTRTGAYAGGPRTDREPGYTGPLYLSDRTFYDRPFTPVDQNRKFQAGTFSAVTFLGNVDFSGKKFQSIGAFSWGYGMNSSGKMSVSVPTGTTSAQRAAAVKVLQGGSPSWTIK